MGKSAAFASNNKATTAAPSESFGTYWTYLVVHQRKIMLPGVIPLHKVQAGVTFLPYLLNLVLTDAGG